MALNPIWLQNLDYSAQLDRQLIQALVSREGVTSPLSLKVIPQSPAAMTVKVLAGGAFIQGDDSVDQGMYFVDVTADVNSDTFNLPAGGYKRIDSICLCVKDPDASGPAGDSAAIVRVQGTAVLNASVAAAPALPATHIRLANVEINSATGSIITANITDARGLCGGIDHVGTIQQWAGDGSLLPDGWLMCQGQAISRTTYAELFALVGTTYGVGDNSTTFELPDMRGRVTLGSGTGDYSSPVSARALGSQGGVQAVTLAESQLPSHFHGMNHTHGTFQTTENGNHRHTLEHAPNTGTGTNTFGLGLLSVSGSSFNSDYAGLHSHYVTISAYTGNTAAGGGGAAHENMPPFTTVNFIIRAL